MPSAIGSPPQRQITRDLGVSWQPLVPELAARGVEVRSVACAGEHAISHVQGGVVTDWLVRTQGSGALEAVLPFATVPLGEFLLARDGTVLANHLAWKPGDPTWSVRLLPAGTTHALGDGSLFATTPTSILRSRDGGATWEETPVATPPPAATRFFADGPMRMWASAGDADQGQFRARLWTSADAGVTWTEVFDRTTTNAMPGMDAVDVAPELVAIGADGAFVATSFTGGLHVSRDRGQTWTSLPFPGGYELSMATSGGVAVTLDRARRTGHPVWHLWHDHGLGNAYRQVTVRLMDGQIADLSLTGGTASSWSARRAARSTTASCG